MSLRCSADTPVLPPNIRFFRGQVGHDAMSAYGPKRTFHFALRMSAFGGKADITVCTAIVCLRLTQSGLRRASARPTTHCGGAFAQKWQVRLVFVVRMKIYPLYFPTIRGRNRTISVATNSQNARTRAVRRKSECMTI
jgi:hypothetical protein